MMKKNIVSFLCWIARKIISLRYDIKISGKELINKKFLNMEKGILVLPNHPAHVDPIILTIFLWPKLQIHPLVTEYVYRQKGLNVFLKAVGTISIPNLETSINELKIKKTEEIINNIIKGLNEGKNYLLYPSGRLKHTGKEIIGGASATQLILQKCKDINVVLIRTTGLWGSSFSRAYEGRSPNIKKTISNNVKKLFKSLVFFMPRRKVKIEISLVPKDFCHNGSRLEVNRYLENWYNRYEVDGKFYETEPLNKVSYSCWKEDLIKPFEISSSKKRTEKKEFSSEIEEKVYKELLLLHPDEDISLDTDLSIDLGMDSLDIAGIISFLNIEYDVSDVHPEDLVKVSDIIELAEGKKKVKEVVSEESTYHWPKEKWRLPPELPMGKTIPESFFLICDKMKNLYACADDVVGPLTYKKLKIAVLALSEKIKKMPGKNIAILLPATVATYMVIFACIIAKKVPVMLNWTLGPRYLNHMMKITEAKVVISSWKFLERLSNVDFGHLIKQVKYLEDIKKEVSSVDKVKALILSMKSPKNLMKNLGLNKISENDTVVILFTSGTEANPKGVPLSHKNILSNERAAMQCAELRSNDIIYGILPPFHSFGFSLAGVFPILSGLKVVYYPNPTDSQALAEGIERWKVTFFCTAPSFLKGLLGVATEKQLKTMRIFFTGAEKTPKELYDRVKKLKGEKKLMEGYGITECSPAISLNRFNRVPSGVGQLIPGIEFCTVDPESHELLEKGKEGEICVRGDSVFSGYIDKQQSPFLTIEGKQWYCTGDLGYLDKEGNIILSGRLKRFTKIGGEMISLSGLEEIISHDLFMRNKSSSDSAQIAVCSSETGEGKSKIIVFSTIDLDKNEINNMLKDVGFSRLVKISEIKMLDEIPLTGTGKIDYRFLQSLIE